MTQTYSKKQCESNIKLRGSLLEIINHEMFVSKREGCSKQTILSGQICFYSLVLYESKEGYTPNIVYDEASAVYMILTCALVAGDAE